MNSQHFNDMASDKPMMDPPLQRWEQPRGGIIIETSIGNLQFGMPPETIKVREEEKNQTPEQLLLNTFYYISIPHPTPPIDTILQPLKTLTPGLLGLWSDGSRVFCGSDCVFRAAARAQYWDEHCRV